MPGPIIDSPVERLRAYSALAPWNLRDLAALTSAVLAASRVSPVSAAARSLPNQRTIRFYVSRGLVTPPDGKGPSATYGYRHFITVLAIKLWQMEGADLARIHEELSVMTGDTLERRVATALGPALPAPSQLDVSADLPSSGRSARVMGQAADIQAARPATGEGPPTTWYRISIEPRIELHVADDHPLSQVDGSEEEIVSAVNDAVARLLAKARVPRVARDAPESP